MACLEVTERSFFKAAADKILTESGFVVHRSDAAEMGPFLITTPEGVVLFKGLTVEQLAKVSKYDLTQFKVIRRRLITIHKTWPGVSCFPLK
jgi:hypothetical protein